MLLFHKMYMSMTSNLVSKLPSYFSHDSIDNELKAQVNLKHTST